MSANTKFEILIGTRENPADTDNITLAVFSGEYSCEFVISVKQFLKVLPAQIERYQNKAKEGVM